MKFVCPLPITWDDIYRKLMRAWELNEKKGQAPPQPLVLSGWSYSNDVEKAKRWQEMIDWAKQNNCEDLIPELHDNQKYCVHMLSSFQVGPLGEPMHLPWDLETKRRPTDDEIENAMKKLKEKWDKIVGNPLAAVTIPISLTGAKCRRLLVKAEPTVKPPWGEWECLDPGEERREFTRLRKSVNNIISPLRVDHIDFDISN